MIIDWNKYFSHIFVISSCLNFEKRNWINQEFSRVGLNNFDYWYNCNDNKLLDFNSNIYLTYKHHNVRYAHYSLIKTCYQLGYDNVLIMEDDICFLNDINQIKEQLELFYDLKYNNDLNIYLFDYFCPEKSFMAFYADCYYLNRKGMEYLIYMVEHHPLNIDSYFFPELLNGFNIDYYNINYRVGTDIFPINIDQSLLPILLKMAPEHICIQKYNSDEPYDFLDESLYNKY